MKLFTDNPIIRVDSYKGSHYLQYAPETTHISSYIESRGGLYGELPFIGARAVILDTFPRPITMADIDEAEEFFTAHGDPFNREGWEIIVRDHAGIPPLFIEALPEGTLVQTGTPLMQIQNVDPRLPWLTSYFETALLRVWYPTTVAARARAIRKIISSYLNQTCDEGDASVAWRLHDFGARGVGSDTSAALGGLGHLALFQGSDNMVATWLARSAYGETMASGSIPAAEHATITSWGRSGEVDAYRNMIRQFAAPGKTVAVVSDSYDIYNAVSKIWGEELRDEVVASGGAVVVRPDSGDPTQVPVEVVTRLAETFGYVSNMKGFKVLPPCVRVIQGDGVDEASIEACLHNLVGAGFSAENLFFGMGGALLQKMDRDTQKFAMKASARRIEGADEWIPYGKDPVTDKGKRQKFGRVAVVSGPWGPTYIPEDQLQGRVNLLRPLWSKGSWLDRETFGEIRARAQA